MVQREVADRFFAAPSTKAYGGVSVLVQLASERTGFHPVARTVFRPPPNVDSALVAFRRRPLPDDFGRVKRVVEAAFSHRRKTLPNSLALAGLCSRAEAAAALASIGRPPEVRAEALAPPEFVTLAGACDESAGAGEDQSRARGRPDPRGRQARGRNGAAAGRSRRSRCDRSRHRAHGRRLPGRHDRPGRARRARRRCGRRSALDGDDQQADPGRSRARRRQLRRGHCPPARQRDAGRAAPRSRSPRGGSDGRRGRPVLPGRRAAARPRRRLGVARRSRCRRTTGS